LKQEIFIYCRIIFSIKALTAILKFNWIGEGSMPRSRDLDIARTVKLIEWLKGELLESVSQLFRALFQNQEELIRQGLARVQLTAYLLGQRVGVNFAQVDLQLEALVRRHIDEKHEVEEWYGDLSALKKHLENRKKGL